MSSRSRRQYLEDIIASATHIAGFIQGVTSEELLVDVQKLSAVERQLLIVAEASAQLKKMPEMLPSDQDWRGWIGLGNIIRHGYHLVDGRALWTAVHEELPAFRMAVEQELARDIE